MSKQVTAIIVGLGGRGRSVYGRYILDHPEDIKVVAIADIDTDKLERGGKDFTLNKDRCFTSAEAIFDQPKMADCALICTQDKDHVRHAKMAIEKGYHLLLEKPVSHSIKECQDLVEIANKHHRHVVVCHVLRYTNFYNTIKESIKNGDVGEVVTVQAIENVGYWHQAHSFVRGNWANSQESSPMILAKSCHDMDILLWLTDKKCQKVSSFGSNYLFKKDKAPEGATMRCTDNCLARSECPYDAVNYYVKDLKTGVRGGKTDWPIDIVAPNPTEENVMEALRTGPYGRCVYHCDNDVVDHQVVNMLCEDDVTISFTMTAFTDRCYRYLKVMGTKGCIEADMDKNIVSITKFGQETVDHQIQSGASIEGHGGGDEKMMDQFVKLMQAPDGRPALETSLERSIESHVVAMTAEASRLRGGEVISIK